MKLHTTLVIEHGLDGLKDNKLTGNVTRVHEGDAVEQAERLADLQLVFGTEFDRGELTVESLRPVLWAAHWLKAIRPVAQRASELLTLAASRAFEPGSKAARDCDAVGRVMASVATTEPHCLTALEAARKIRVPADFYEQTSKTGLFSLADLSALRVDGIRPTALLTSEESQALAEQIRSTADAVEAVGAELAESEPQAADDTGSTVGANDSPFAVYEFPHEMYAALRSVSENVGGMREVEKQGLAPTPEMLKVSAKVHSEVDELLGRIDGASCTYRPTALTDKKMVEEAMRYRDKQERKADSEDRLGRIERGLLALANYLGRTTTERTLAAMERPA